MINVVASYNMINVVAMLHCYTATGNANMTLVATAGPVRTTRYIPR